MLLLYINMYEIVFYLINDKKRHRKKREKKELRIENKIKK